MIKGVCFDIGGTIIDFVTDSRMTQKLSVALEKNPDDIKVLVRDNLLTKKGRIEELFRNFAKEAGYNKPEQLIELALNHKSIPQLYPDTISTLKAIKSKGYKLGAISNAFCWNNVNLDSLGLEGIFDSVIYSFETGVAKPQPQAFKNAEERLGLKPEELIHVGDSLKSDVSGANNCRWKSVFINRKKVNMTKETIKPTYIINELNELIDILNQL